jgi:hypothetical protein
MQNPTTVVVTTAYSHRWYCTSSLAAFYTLLLSALHHFTSAHMRVMHATNPGQSRTPSCSLAGPCRLQCPVLHVCKENMRINDDTYNVMRSLHRSDPGGAMCLLLHGAMCMAGALRYMLPLGAGDLHSLFRELPATERRKAAANMAHVSKPGGVVVSISIRMSMAMRKRVGRPLGLR